MNTNSPFVLVCVDRKREAVVIKGVLFNLSCSESSRIVTYEMSVHLVIQPPVLFVCLSVFTNSLFCTWYMIMYLCSELITPFLNKQRQTVYIPWTEILLTFSVSIFLNGQKSITFLFTCILSNLFCGYLTKDLLFPRTLVAKKIA